MHFFTLVAVEVEKTEPEPEVDALYLAEADRLAQMNENTETTAGGNGTDCISDIFTRLRERRLRYLSSRFARAVDESVAEAMEPYCESTDNPLYLEIEDCTEELTEQYQNESDTFIRLPDGKFISQFNPEFRSRFVLRDHLVYERNAGPCLHEKRTKKAKKMTAVVCRFSRVYKSVLEFAEQYHGYRYDAQTGKIGYECNPNAFWDWYQIGGRWPAEFLVRSDCTEYSLGERNDDLVYDAPEGYIWVSAARKKDIAWDAMRTWKQEEAIRLFEELEGGFKNGIVPEGYWGKICEEGILGFNGFLYRNAETVEDYLARHHLTDAEKYSFRPYGFLDETGWNTHREYEYRDGHVVAVEDDTWVDSLYAFIDNADDETVLVAVDNHD